jgi:thiosulfate reductase cytochrome b subunit
MARLDTRRFEQAAARGIGHALWVRFCHWIAAASFLTLAVTGIVVLMAHPRLYWGEVGNDLTPALFELPISANYHHGGWERNLVFTNEPGSPVSASRTVEIFNQNGWARSLHFLAAWFLVAAGAVYLLAGLYTGHLRRDLVPRKGEAAPRVLGRELLDRLRGRIPPTAAGPPYGALQKAAYLGVVLIALPLMVLTGLAMSPAIDSAYPLLPAAFGGSQSARTIHFFMFAALAFFAIGHVIMVVLSGFRRQMRAMIWGARREKR